MMEALGGHRAARGSMGFSKRVGLEPASDLKRRLVSLCEEAGFVVSQARVVMRREETLETSFRTVLVWMHEPESVGTARQPNASPSECTPQIGLWAVIGCDGSFDGEVVVTCSAAEEGEPFGPTLRNGRMRIEQLPVKLRQIAEQRRHILQARIGGERGPWHLGGFIWEELRIL
jgi:hypothetical protein